MDVREKLVELLDEAEEWADHKCDELDCETCYAGKMKGNCVQKLMVDRLIAHGVTVQEGISVKDRLPEHGDVVLCFMKFGEQRILQWDKVSSLWLGYGHGDDWQKADVTHWCCLPQPPKGE